MELLCNAGFYNVGIGTANSSSCYENVVIQVIAANSSEKVAENRNACVCHSRASSDQFNVPQTPCSACKSPSLKMKNLNEVVHKDMKNYNKVGQKGKDCQGNAQKYIQPKVDKKELKYETLGVG